MLSVCIGLSCLELSSCSSGCARHWNEISNVAHAGHEAKQTLEAKTKATDDHTRREKTIDETTQINDQTGLPCSALCLLTRVGLFRMLADHSTTRTAQDPTCAPACWHCTHTRNNGEEAIDTLEMIERARLLVIRTDRSCSRRSSRSLPPISSPTPGMIRSKQRT